MHQLKVIIASRRAGRKGPVVANWFLSILDKYSEFEVEVLDLKEVDLPFLDEPEHPKLQNYRHKHTKQWSRTIDSADAFVFVTCEYNHGYPASLKNALDFVYHEWTYKPVGFVGYGGLAGGIRAIELLKPVVVTQKMVPLVETVNIPFFTNYINENGIFEGTQEFENSAGVMLKELARWSECLKGMREKKS